MRLPLLFLALAFFAAGCGGGGGGGDNGEAADEGLLDTRTAEAPPDVRVGAGQPGGVGAEVPETVLIQLGDKGTVTLDFASAKTSNITLDLVEGGKVTVRSGTCDSPGKVVADLGDNAAGFVQEEVAVGVAALQKSPHVVMLGKTCAAIPGAK